ncbi:MAG: hypothetical protein ACRCZE_02435 [Candidatus Altimarinota bacterium]
MRFLTGDLAWGLQKCLQIKREETVMDNGFKKVFVCGQWAFCVKLPEGKVLDMNGEPVTIEAYEMVNLGKPSEAGQELPRRFYQMQSGQYGEPLMRPEPTYGLDLPNNLVFRRKKKGLDWDNGEVFYPLEKLTGVLCNEVEPPLRASLTRLVDEKKPYGFNPDGSFQVDGKIMHLRTIFNKDKKRFVGSVDGFFSLTKPDYVRYVELEELELGSLEAIVVQQNNRWDE